MRKISFLFIFLLERSASIFLSCGKQIIFVFIFTPHGYKLFTRTDNDSLLSTTANNTSAVYKQTRSPMRREQTTLADSQSYSTTGDKSRVEINERRAPRQIGRTPPPPPPRPTPVISKRRIIRSSCCTETRAFRRMHFHFLRRSPTETSERYQRARHRRSMSAQGDGGTGG